MPDWKVNSNFPENAGGDRRMIIEEIACAIAEAQAALFAGRVQDLERCILLQKKLCAAWQGLQDSLPEPENTNADDHTLVLAAQRVQRQNLLFGAIVRRMRRHLETLRHLLNGLSLTYQPKPVEPPAQES